MAYKIFLRTAAFPKADVENIGVGIALDGSFWPKAEVRLVRGIISVTDPKLTLEKPNLLFFRSSLLDAKETLASRLA
ncbi:MAG: hypothetical protein OET44_18550 [Gammaproteobacteria bacterium]|nr:hypothetical protein [Gammaproteobacteria bacterium]